MRNLKDILIYELNDDTYLKLALKRKQQNKNIDDIINHSYNIISRKFIDDLYSLDWYQKYIEKITYNKNKDFFKEKSFEDDHIFYLVLHIKKDIIKSIDHKLTDKKTYFLKRGSKSNDIICDLYDECKLLCKKYNKFIHKFYFECYEGKIYFYIFDRKKHISHIKKDTILYHLTDNKSFVDNIIKNGIKCKETVNFINNHFEQYTYNCVFAFETEEAAIYYEGYISNDSNIYYLIEFKAGDNIYFNDQVYNNQGGGGRWAVEENNLKAVFTLTDIDANQIIKITELNENKSYRSKYYKKIIYENRI